MILTAKPCWKATGLALLHLLLGSREKMTVWHFGTGGWTTPQKWQCKCVCMQYVCMREHSTAHQTAWAYCKVGQCKHFYCGWDSVGRRDYRAQPCNASGNTLSSPACRAACLLRQGTPLTAWKTLHLHCCLGLGLKKWHSINRKRHSTCFRK